MKLSEHARRVGVHNKTAWRWWHAGTLDVYQAASGMVIVREPADMISRLPAHQHVALYAVSRQWNIGPPWRAKQSGW